MRSTFFTLITIICFVQFSFAQNNSDFVNFDNQWNINTSLGLGQAQTTKYRFDGDSIVINSIIYFTMEYSQEELGTEWTPYEISAYRQEDGKVYQVNLEDNTEMLLYNFDLVVGDVLLGSEYVGEPDLTVVDIDSLQLEDGSFRKRLQMSAGNSCTIPWVEGLGSIYYSFNTAMYTCFADIGDNLICYSQNEVPLFYRNGESFGCWSDYTGPPKPSLVNFDSQWNTLFSSQFTGNQTTTKSRFNPTPVQYGIHNYFRLERSNEENGTEWTLTENQVFREDYFGRVYIFNELDSTELLIHDFELMVGDTFISKQYISDPGTELIVTTVDTVQLANGSDRKRILLNCVSGNFEIQWLEGIGNIDYPLASTIYTCFFDIPGSLLCYSENGETLYEGVSNIEGCWYDYEPQLPNLINFVSDWNVLTSSQDGSELSTAIFSFDQTVRIYNGKEYYHLESIDDPGSVDWMLDELHAFREEEEKVYLYNGALNSEILIYDFSLTEGETFLLKQSFDDTGSILTVTKVDSIELLDGTLRKRIKLNCELNNSLSWVQGIGNTSRPLANTIFACQFEFNIQLLCYAEFGQTQFESVNNFQSCWVTDVEEIPESEISIYPNPVSNKLFIDAETPIKFAKIYNLQGQLMIENSETHSIDITELSAGMYFLNLVNKDGQELSKRIVVE